jgi:hypothetical protein
MRNNRRFGCAGAVRTEGLLVGGGDMRIYWIKAQAPRRVLALAKHLGIEGELLARIGNAAGGVS